MIQYESEPARLHQEDLLREPARDRPAAEAARAAASAEGSTGEPRVPRLKITRIARDKKISPYFAT